MPQLSITPQTVLTLLPPPTHPDRFSHICNMVNSNSSEPLTREEGALAIQADNIYTAENMVSPWDPSQRVDTYVTGDTDLFIGNRTRYGHGVLFFEEVPHVSAPPSPPPLPVPAATPVSMDMAIGIPSYHIPAPPSPPPLVAAMIEQARAENLAGRVTPVGESSGESLMFAKALVIALTEALVQVLATSVVNTPPPYGIPERTPETADEEAPVNATGEEKIDEDELEYMELQYPATPEPDEVPALVSALATGGEQNHEIINVDELDTSEDEDMGDEDGELTRPATPRYNLRTHGASSNEAMNDMADDPFPDRANLALRGAEAANLELLLTRPPKYWNKADRVVIKAAIQSLHRALKSGVGYGETPRMHPVYSF